MLGHAPGWGFWDRGTTGTELALSQVKIRKGKRRKKNRGRERRGEEEEDKKKRKKACEYRGFQGTARQVKQ